MTAELATSWTPTTAADLNAVTWITPSGLSGNGFVHPFVFTSMQSAWCTKKLLFACIDTTRRDLDLVGADHWTVC